MRRLVFIYAGAPSDQRNCSPYTITRHLYDFFVAQGVEVIYKHWDSQEDFTIGVDDVLLAHPHYGETTITQKIFRQNQPCHAKFTIHPLHTRRPQDNLPFDFMARQADGIFAICGPFWFETLEDTPFVHWRPKITRLDMAVDPQLWPHRKASFRGPGQRGIVYVGSSMPQKNLSMLTHIAKKLPNVRFQWYGGSSDHALARLRNVHVEGWQEFTADKVAQICAQNDLFINTSVSDAGPTTLLEFGLASGLIPLCTYESGYWNDPCFINIPLGDIPTSVRVVKEWLHKPTEELQRRSQANRDELIRRYTWPIFCDTVWQRLKPYLL
jgi:glycosyltransferase involved in cell wall biosynthesis